MHGVHSQSQSILTYSRRYAPIRSNRLRTSKMPRARKRLPSPTKSSLLNMPSVRTPVLQQKGEMVACYAPAPPRSACNRPSVTVSVPKRAARPLTRARIPHRHRSRKPRFRIQNVLSGHKRAARAEGATGRSRTFSECEGRRRWYRAGGQRLGSTGTEYTGQLVCYRGDTAISRRPRLVFRP